MTRAEFVVGAIVLSAILAVGLQKAIKEGRAQAQAQTVSPESTIWDHNGSIMYLVANGSSREFYYQKPRPGMLDAGARPGSLLIRGQVNEGQYSGTAYIFNSHCGPIPFQVKGPILDNDERILLTGEAPRIGRNCNAYGSYTSNLEFRRLKPNEAAQSYEAMTAAQPPAIRVSKPQVPTRKGDELPSAPAAQPSVKNEIPVAAKDSSAGVADPNVLSTPTAQAPVTNETSGAKDLDKYKWGAAFIVMIVWLSIALFGKILIRRKG
jgi:hypothetical protein